MATAASDEPFLEPTSPALSERPKLLLVDDRPENLLALEALMQGSGAEIVKAYSARQALELLLVHEVALAIIDVEMPEMDGFQVAELMRGIERTREIPIIFVTAGFHDQARVFKGYESGAVDFLIKPLEPRILMSKVGVFLLLYQQRRQLAERNARLIEADRRKNDFLAVLSHELRNPLAPLKSSLYVLERAAPGSEQAKRALRVIDRQVTQLENLVNDLLDVTRLSHKKIKLQKERLDLNDLVRRTVEDNCAAFEKNEIHLDLSVAPAAVYANVDATRVAQLVGNLLQNAAKFTRRGGRTRASLASEAGKAVIRVADDGIGMTPETLSRLFQPFSQADHGLDRSKGGLGLGLALVKGLVELHGGSIGAFSAGLGMGAEFVVRLPLAEGPPAPRTEVRDRTAHAPRRVLIIEDNADAADSLKEALELREHQVAVAYSGPEGIEKTDAFRPDIILCDIGLPGMDGYEVARAIRSDEIRRRAFLVALSGYALPEDLERAARAGFQRHIAKPPDLERLEELFWSIQPSGGGPGAPESRRDR